MKKYLILLTALSLSTGAFADNLVNGPYVAGHVGFDYTDYKAKGSKTEDDTRFAWDMALGLRVRSLRAEVEWANTTRSHLKTSRTEQQRYMAQFYYDFPLRSVIRPFLNVGAGAAYTETTYRPKNKVSKHSDDTTFCWNAGAGLGLNLNRYFSFDVGYRYIDAGRPNFGKGIPATKITHHEAYTGLRVTF